MAIVSFKRGKLAPSLKKAVKSNRATGSVKVVATKAEKLNNREFVVEASCGSNNGSAVITWCDNGKREVVQNLSQVIGTRVG